MSDHVRQTVRVADPEPLGEVTLVPREMSGQSEADLARAVADATDAAEPRDQTATFRLFRLS